MAGGPEFSESGVCVASEESPASRQVGFVLFEPKEGTKHWIQPIEELPFKVQLLYLSDEEQTEIFDRYRLYPGSPKNTMHKLSQVATDMIERRVVAWEHPETVFTGEPPEYPCTGWNKQRLNKVFFRRGDQDTTTLWRLIVETEEKLLEAERKN